jgi:hypothetical protein
MASERIFAQIPTRHGARGINLAVAHLPAIAVAINKALDAGPRRRPDRIAVPRMTAATANDAASRIKRYRASQAEMQDRAEALVDIVTALAPATVRQTFYAATVRGIVEKTEPGYNRIQRDLVALRLAGRIGWDQIADNTRWVRRPRSYRGAADALEATALLYRKNLWADAATHVEVWCEKDALAGIISDVTSEYDVPLFVSRGYSSVTYLYEAAAAIPKDGRPAYVYHLGDYDPSGVNAASKIEQKLKQFAPTAEIHFERLAVLPWQIEAWRLPTRPTKTSDSRSKTFGPTSVELDAIDPHRLRSIVCAAVERHLPRHQLELLKVAERSEREGLFEWSRQVQGGRE